MYHIARLASNCHFCTSIELDLSTLRVSNPVIKTYPHSFSFVLFIVFRSSPTMTDAFVTAIA